MLFIHSVSAARTTLITCVIAITALSLWFAVYLPCSYVNVRRRSPVSPQGVNLELFGLRIDG